VKLSFQTYLAATVAALALTACNGESPTTAAAPAATPAATPAPGPGEPTLDELRQITEKYKDINVALAEGYVRDPMDLCDTAAMMGKPAELGAMGVHYVNFAQAGVTAPPNPLVDGNGMHTDFRKPTVLIYEPQADGSFQLVAVENLVFKKAWEEAGNTKPPTFHGVDYDYMADDPATPLDEAHMFAPHYDRHVWIHRENPNGVFTPHNPKVSCEHHKGAKEFPKMPPAQTTAPTQH
jgi:hypothetical protein